MRLTFAIVAVVGGGGVGWGGAAVAGPAAKASPTFSVRSGSRIEGDRLAAPPSTANCETRCQTETACVGYSLSRDGVCELFGRIEARVEDGKWRSGVRN